MDRQLREQLEAVALSYRHRKDHAPKVTAKGRGETAERILELARSYDIPIHEDKNLIQVLSRLDLQEEIPLEVYRAVAEILVFLYWLAQQEPQEAKEN